MSTIPRSVNLLLVIATLCMVVFSSAVSAEVELSKHAFAQVDAILKREIERGKLPGAVTLAVRDSETVHSGAMGYRDLENKIPMTEDTLFRLYSMSKPITGTALMILYEQGKFQLADSVELYIPEFKGLRVYTGKQGEGTIKTQVAKHPITIHELITHSAGFVYVPPYSRGRVAALYGEANLLDRSAPLEDMIAKLARLPLAYQPGTRQQYSSISVDIQGRLIEVISGESLDVFLTKNIFKPLEMNDTGFAVPAGSASRLTREYNVEPKGGLYSDPNQRFLTKPILLSAASGLVSTASDYARFAEMLLNGGELNGTRILASKTVGLMRDMVMPDGVRADDAYFPGTEFRGYFGVVTERAGDRDLPVGSMWWWGRAGTWFWIDPADNLVYVGMTQIGDFRYFNDLLDRVRRVAYRRQGPSGR